ncbi:MAG TPA: NUDIX domain-containing protein [Candidatus Corynebacterium avicola]|uniref:NUDIX domain-containing protein n=1 Tax=Candidatus Corynebacterium avicola TaxID=2838527 RepID=A0A9D1UMW7_9CORY|nr:NUDIX domain-containing protein [Candidatus Corynebacterium avicola]
MAEEIRIAVRVVLLDADNRVLLFEGRDLSDATDTRRFWFTAGGGVDDGESLGEAAEREILEETGQKGLVLVGPFHRREVDFLNHGEPLHQVEHYYAARTTEVTLSQGGWTALEGKAMTSWRWWSAGELDSADVEYFPENLPELVTEAARLL